MELTCQPASAAGDGRLPFFATRVQTSVACPSFCTAASRGWSFSASALARKNGSATIPTTASGRERRSRPVFAASW
jgi:hypothetical protein